MILQEIIGGFMYKGYRCFIGHHVSEHDGAIANREWYCGYMTVDSPLTDEETSEFRVITEITFNHGNIIGFHTCETWLLEHGVTEKEAINFTKEMVDNYITRGDKNYGKEIY